VLEVPGVITAGLNCVPVIPVPLNVPPLGVAYDATENAASYSQTAGILCSVTEGKACTVICLFKVLVQLVVASVYEYIKLYVPAVVGLNCVHVVEASTHVTIPVACDLYVSVKFHHVVNG
jgi:hypothetical protein